MSLPLFIVNPRAGGGRAGEGAASLAGLARPHLGEIDVAFTERQGHGLELSRRAAQAGRRLIVAVGGDGTLNEVTNGVLASGCEAEVGFVGAGTGGDFARTLGLEPRADAQLAAIASGRVRRVDVGELSYRDPSGRAARRFFLNVASAGMSGLVDRYVADAPRALGAKGAYVAASVKALLGSRAGRVRCTSMLGGAKREDRLWPFLIAVCNGGTFGAGMAIAPMARPDDGRFEVVSISAPSKIAFAATAQSLTRGEHLGRDGVVHFGCERVSLALSEGAESDAFLLDVDGEALGGLPIDVQVLPRALAIRA